MQNEVFNGSRFWNYFKYDATQMVRNHMRAAIGIGLSGLIVYVIVVGFCLLFNGEWTGPGIKARFMVFYAASVILQLYQTRTYGYLTEKRKGSAWLMLPASTFEKWLSMILMTLIVIPVLFLVVSLTTDALVAALDPTVGNSLLYSFSHGMRDISGQLININGEYNTSWSVHFLLPSMIVAFCANYLFFLLCGILFKKHKILSAFVIIFVVSSLFSIVASLLDINTNVEVNDFAEAELFIRSIFNTVTWVSGLIAVGLAGGIFYRLKTLKH